MSAITTTTVQRIQSLADELDQLGRTALEKAIEAGKLLRECKSALAHGQWLPWLEENFSFTDRTARNYMQIAEANESGKLETVSDLTEAYRIMSKSSSDNGCVKAPARPINAEPQQDERLTDKESARLTELESTIEDARRRAYDGILETIPLLSKAQIKSLSETLNTRWT